MSLDNSPGTTDLSAAVQGLSDSDKREIQTFIQNEQQRAGIQESVHNLTAMCFKKCITSRISSSQLDRYEEPCMNNCVARFMDANMVTLKHLERMRQS